MKKIVCILLVICVLLIGCNDRTERRRGGDDEETVEVTTSTSRVVDPEYSALEGLYSYVTAYRDIYDAIPEKTKYNITSIENCGADGWIVYGKCWLYDEYGDCVRSAKFEIAVRPSGSAHINEFMEYAY